MKSGYVRENPMPLVKLHIKPKPTEDKEVYTLDKIELDALLEKIIIVDNHCPRKDYTQFNYYSYAVALFIGWYTGLRVSETFGLRKEDFDFENNTIKIQRRLEYNGLKKKDLYTTEDLKSKNAKATIPMVSKLREGMLKWFEKNPYEKVNIYSLCHLRNVDRFLLGFIKSGIKDRRDEQLSVHYSRRVEYSCYRSVLPSS